MQSWKENNTSAMSESPRDMSKIPLSVQPPVEFKKMFFFMNKSLFMVVLRHYNA
jgi:hypothetical protein